MKKSNYSNLTIWGESPGPYGGAEFSQDKKHRLYLWREIDPNNTKWITYIGLNPSTANEYEDDRTISKLINFTKQFGYGRMYMLNLFSFITPYTTELHAAPIKMVADYDIILKAFADLCNDVVLCWGAFKGIDERAN